MPTGSPESLHDFPDRAIRDVLRQRDNLRDLLQAVIPDLAPAFECERAEPVGREFLLEDWRGREADLLFRVPFQAAGGEQPALVCVLIEHQSAPDRLMPLRMLLDAVLFWERQWRDWEEGSPPRAALRLSPVVPIVFHTGPNPWRTSRELVDLIEGPESLHEFVPRWRTLFWDLAERTPRDMLDMAGEFLKTLAMVRAEREPTVSFLDVCGEVVQGLEPLGVRDKMRWNGLMRFLLSWGLLRRPEDEHETLIEMVLASQTDLARREELRAMSSQLGQTLVERAMAEGERSGFRSMLRELLEEQFGALPEALVQRIEACGEVAKLRAAIRQVSHRIDSLDQLHLE
jgi:hypothetical protein